MLSAERIRTMAKLNRYETGPEKEYLKLNHIYRSDYIGMELLKNFCCITIAYILLIGIGCLYHFDFLTNNWFRVDLTAFLVKAVGIYAVLLIGYSVFVYMRCSIRYKKMKVYIKDYVRELRDLESLYENPEKNEEEYFEDRGDIT